VTGDVPPKDRGKSGGRPPARKGLRAATQVAAFLESTTDCVYVVDRDWRFTYLNKRAIAELGEGRDLVGMTVAEAFPGQDGTIGEPYRRVMAGGPSESFEHRSEALGAWYEIQITAIPDGLVVSFRNIEARKQSEQALRDAEQRFRLAARAANELIGDWDLVANRVHWSEAITRLFGYPADHQETDGQWWLDRIHPDDRTEISRRLDAVVNSDEDLFYGRYRFRRADGSYAHVVSRGYLMRGEDGRPLRLVSAAQDLTHWEQAAEALEERDRQLVTVFGQAMVGLMHASADRKLLMVNDRFCEILGRTREEVAGLRFEDITHPDDIEPNRVLIERGRKTGEPFQVEKRYIRPDGSIVWCGVHFSFVRDQAGEVRSTIVFAEDISARKQAEAALHESDSLSHSIVEASTDCIMLLDLDGCIQFVNQAGRGTIEFGVPSHLYGRSWAETWPEEARAHVETAVESARSGEVARFTAEFVTPKGNRKWLDVVVSPAIGDDGRPLKLVSISRDMTQQKAAEDRVRWSAAHDALTGLPNRVMFQEKLAEAIREARATGGRVGLLNLDLDHFKQVNDSLGHDAGDMLLKTFANRLRSVVRSDDTVARLGGDEFAVVLPGLADDQDIDALADSIIDRMREPFVYAERILDCRTSIGASIYPVHGTTTEELLKNSDVALYIAKHAARGRMMVFRKEMRSEMRKRASMVEMGRDAVRDDRVVPFYQPKVGLRTDEVVGFEALLRWRNAGGDIQPPAAIAAAFEDLEVAMAISDRMIQRIVADMRRWLDRGIEFGHVALNAAAAEFRHDNFAERVLEELGRAGIPTRRFQLEVTETVFLGRGAENVERALKLLSVEGVTIALDDFGTGYASLRHLKQFPVDIIKIDQSFVRGLDEDGDDAAIVHAVLKLSHSLGIKTVAEGIESTAQAEHLIRLGCDYGQGFLFSKAIAAMRVPAFLSSWRGIKTSPRLDLGQAA